MATKATAEKSHACNSNPQLLKLGIAASLVLLVAFGLFGGAWAKLADRSVINTGSRSDKDPVGNHSTATKPRESFTQNETPTPTPSFRGLSDSPPPESSSTSLNSSASSSGQSQAYINFDDIPTWTAVSNQYSPAVFSSDFWHYPLADNQYWGNSRPNLLGRAPTFGFYDGTGYAPLYVDFTTPVNDLKFYVVAVDEFRRGIAQINIFQNHRLTATRDIDGHGVVFIPVLVDVGGWGFQNVTRIEIVNINDINGVGFDDFSFTIAPPPSPTPTPTPPVPAAPSGLTATASEQRVSLSWNASQGADGYYVKRTGGTGTYETVAAVSASTITSASPIIVPGPATSYIDNNVKGGTTYTYVVSAFNNAGPGPDSNQASAAVPSACGEHVEPFESSVHLHSISGWDMTAEVSANDGVVLRDVSLNGRYMARSISVTYFKIQTSTSGGIQRGELKPSSNSAILRSRLVQFLPSVDGQLGGGIAILAHYIVDRISPESDSCLHVWQEYIFAGKDLTGFLLGGRSCEPSGTVPCDAFFPQVHYRFEPRGGEVLFSFNAIQRNQFWVDGSPFNGIGVFRDCDSPPPFDCKIEVDADQKTVSAFKNKLNPLTTELRARVINRGQDAGQWDNIHQTYKERIFKEPGFSPGTNPRLHFIEGGCPECVHTHWRWGKVLPNSAEYGNGNVGLYYANSDQDMDFAIVKYKSLEQENTEPLDYAALANGESIRLGADVGDQVLVYYSATGYRNEDAFFRHLYFFNPDFGSGTRSVQNNPSATSGNTPAAAQDGPISVTFPHIYQDGSVSFTEIDPNIVAPLPQGYVAYNSVAYNITTEAEVSGPYVVSFGVPSATNQSVFDSLRILHAEPDSLDPESGIWVDRTILPPDAQGPDFSGKIINAKVNNLAAFVIARLVQPQPPNTGTADLSVSTAGAPDAVVAPNNLTYTVTINNAGPNAATGVGLIDTLSSDVEFVSASPNQGTCKVSDGSVYCKLGSLNSGASTTVTIVVTPNEGGNRFPPEGQPVLNTAFVVANENDPNKDNNSFVKSNTVLPNPNAPPTVGITSPTLGARYVGPANITVSANATDTDGAITQVSFYDGETLIGSGAPAGSNHYSLAWNNVGFGQHSLVAVATDSGGRKIVSSPVNILVNGPATSAITSPATGSLVAPHSNVVITANASIPSGVINKVDFFANSTLLGTVNGGGQCSVNWNDVPNGKYSLTAVVTDGSGITTTSMPVTVVVSNTPTINITTPQDGALFGISPVLTIAVNVQDDDSIIDKVTFFANGTALGTGLRSGLNQFTFTWRGAPDGIFSLTGVTVDQYGLTTTSPAITIGVNTPGANAGEFIWFDDDVPPGATKHAEGDVEWYWVDANPGSFSGTKAHQSRNFAQLDLPNNSLHQHYFEGATTTLPVNAGDKLFTYVFLDVNSMPREIMLQWNDGNGWEHRAYWGANRINWGADGTNSRRFMGPLPKAGQWVRLEVSANLLGLEGSTLNGMAFTLDAGRATFDLTGKAIADAAPPPVTPPGDLVWIEDGLPAGAVTAAVNDQWNLVTNPVYSGQAAHQSQVSVNHNTLIYRSHSFTGAQTPMQVNPGDVLFTYVYVDPSAPAQQIMLQWYDGTSWEHRAFWSSIFVGSKMPNSGVWGTESQRYMGGLPPSGSWYRLEVPASYVGLEGKAVSGMAFSLYGLEPTATWDRSGKAAQITSAPRPLSATAGVFRLFNSTYGYAFETTDLAALDHTVQTSNVFSAHTSQAAGTVPMYRFRRPTNYEYFYSRCKECYVPPSWQYEGIAFYVYPDATTPGTAPLYLYHDSQFHYFLTVNQSEAAGMTFDAIWAYTYAINPVAPVNAAPVINLASPTSGALFTAPATVGISASASDSDGSISKVEFFQGSTKLGEVDAAPYTFNWNNVAFGSYVLTAVATDNLGSGAVSNPVSITVNAPPNVNLTSPGAGTNFPANTPITINASASDSDGTIAKVEFFANSNKLGEVTNGPYVFTWNNASTGTYSVTASATDNLGATSTSGAVSITVGKSDQTITFDPIPDKTYGDTPFSINATSSSGLPVSFTVISGATTVSANTVTITGAGSVSIRADQAGNDSFNPAQSVTRSFNVAKAAATIMLSNLSQTYNGTPKPAATTTNPAGLSGVTITYNGSSTAPTNTGNYSVVASLTNNNYTAGNATGTLAIAKASQAITFNALAGKTYGDAPLAVSGSSSSGLTISFAIVSGPATISGTIVTITGVGTVTVRASQAGDANYNAAADVDRTFSVAKAAATIMLSNLSQTYNGTPKTATATTNPAGLSGVTITYNGSSTAPTNAGSYSVVVSLTNDNYTASNATGTLVIGRATPTISWSDPSGITYGTALSSAQLNAIASFGGSNLPGSFAYTPAAGTVLNPGNGQVISTIFTPADSVNFNNASTSVHINVNALPSINITSPTAGAVFFAPASLSINASASDSDGTISKVEFFQAGILLGTDTTSPYNFTWSNVAVGNYTLTAEATDNLGAATTSSSISVSVVQPINSGKIAFAGNRDGVAQIYSMNQDGSSLVRLTNNAANNENPRWSPDNSRIVFQSDRDNVFSGSADVYVMNADGSGQTRLTSDVYDDSVPVWSPDGTKIAFQSIRNGVNYQVYVMNADGSGQVNISNSSANGGQPSWSPDGTKIAFASDRDHAGFSNIYVMNATGSNQTRLSFSGSGFRDEQPAWSPDGMKLAFTSTRDSVIETWQETDDDGGILVRTAIRSNKEVYVMNADGSAVLRLTNTLENDDSPAWSPDGTKIIFRSDRERDGCDPTAQVWTMNSDGSNQANLSNNGFGDYCPSWSR